jgi:hypothetical protein
MRFTRNIAACLTLGATAACANTQPAVESPSNGPVAAQPGAPALQCEPSPRMPVEGRQSPYDSASVRVGNQELLICYGRPQARGREIFGGLVPYGRLWRTGANEPTIMHLPFTADIAGLTVPPGSYSIYTEPGETEWTLIVNRATAQWGHEGSYTDAVREQELGRATIRAERLDQHIEEFTIRGEPSAAGADILLEWERTRARIPVRALGD